MLLRLILSRAVQPLLNALLQVAHELQELKAMSGSLSAEISKLRDSVSQLTTVDQSVTALIAGFDERVTAAVQKALDAGATEEQLASIREMSAAIVGEAKTLAQAVVTGTPSAPTAPAPAPVETDPAPVANDPAAPATDPAVPAAPAGEATATGTLTAG